MLKRARTKAELRTINEKRNKVAPVEVHLGLNFSTHEKAQNTARKWHAQIGRTLTHGLLGGPYSYRGTNNASDKCKQLAKRREHEQRRTCREANIFDFYTS